MILFALLTGLCTAWDPAWRPAPKDVRVYAAIADGEGILLAGISQGQRWLARLHEDGQLVPHLFGGGYFAAIKTCGDGYCVAGSVDADQHGEVVNGFGTVKGRGFVGRLSRDFVFVHSASFPPGVSGQLRAVVAVGDAVVAVGEHNPPTLGALDGWIIVSTPNSGYETKVGGGYGVIVDAAAVGDEVLWLGGQRRERSYDPWFGRFDPKLKSVRGDTEPSEAHDLWSAIAVDDRALWLVGNIEDKQPLAQSAARLVVRRLDRQGKRLAQVTGSAQVEAVGKALPAAGGVAFIVAKRMGGWQGATPELVFVDARDRLAVLPLDGAALNSYVDFATYLVSADVTGARILQWEERDGVSRFRVLDVALPRPFAP